MNDNVLIGVKGDEDDRRDIALARRLASPAACLTLGHISVVSAVGREDEGLELELDAPGGRPPMPRLQAATPDAVRAMLPEPVGTLVTTDEQTLGGLERLSRDECIAALHANRLGRVVTTFGPDHRPLVRPVSYACDPRSGSIVFHSLSGGKLSALLECRDACFEIDGESDGCMWSVIIRGRVETEGRPREIARLEQLDLSPAPAIPADASWVRIRGEVITGVRFPAPSQA